jgi:hypothetical protein
MAKRVQPANYGQRVASFAVFLIPLLKYLASLMMLASHRY